MQLPNGNVAASYAGLVLEYRGTTLQDVYDARTFIEAPCAALLAQRRTEQDLVRLKQAVAQAEQLMDDPQAFIRAHMEFHALVVELAGNQTLTVLNGMVRHLIELANWSHVDLDAGSPDNVRANKRGFRAHVRLVELVTERQAAEAEALWRPHLAEAENYLQGQALTLDDAVAFAARKGSGRKRPATGWASLTPAEREVVRLVGEGLRNDAIARRLFIAPGTVKVHLTHIFAKLSITTRARTGTTRSAPVDGRGRPVLGGAAGERAGQFAE